MYARHIPMSVFSLALVVDGTPILGVVYDPWMSSLYYAEKGKGAFCNGEKIHVSDVLLDDMKSVSHYDMCRHLCCAGAEHRHQWGHQHGDLDLHGLHGAAVLHTVQDREPRKKRVLRPLKRKEAP